jgi:cation transport ATPase
MIQMWLRFTPPALPFGEWIPFAFSVVIFAYGGVPFIKMAIPEWRDRKPGMMTLISLAISVAFIYSVAAQFVNLGEGFFWELVTLIDIMLLGHWLEIGRCARPRARSTNSQNSCPTPLNASIMATRPKPFPSRRSGWAISSWFARARASLQMAKWLMDTPMSANP